MHFCNAHLFAGSDLPCRTVWDILPFQKENKELIQVNQKVLPDFAKCQLVKTSSSNFLPPKRLAFERPMHGPGSSCFSTARIAL
jgi:hypothetical protein